MIKSLQKKQANTLSTTIKIKDTPIKPYPGVVEVKKRGAPTGAIYYDDLIKEEMELNKLNNNNVITVLSSEELMRDKEYLKIDQSKLPIEIFDNLEYEMNDKPPSEWIATGCNATSPFYRDGNWIWRQCKVLSYDDTTQLFQIKFLPDGLEKHVKRLNIKFDLENSLSFDERRNSAEEFRNEAKSVMRLDYFITQQPNYLIHPIRKDTIKSIHEKVIDGLPLYLPFPEQGTPLGLVLRNLTADVIQCIEKAKEDGVNFNMREKVFGFIPTDYSILDKLTTELSPFSKLWNMVSDFYNSTNDWLHGNFKDLDSKLIEENILEWYRTSYKLSKSFEEQYKGISNCALLLRNDIEEFRKHLPIIQSLASKALQRRHWDQLSSLLGTRIDPERDDTLTLQRLLDLNVNQYIESISDISMKAEKEFNLENSLKLMKKEWETIDLELKPYKDTGSFVIGGIDEIIALLDDHIVKTQTMRGSPYIKPIEEKCKKWELKLKYAQVMLDELIQCQRTWMYLEPIFSSEDIMRQLPTEARRFNGFESDLKISAMISIEGEVIKMDKIVDPETPNNKGNVEKWLLEIESIQWESIRSLTIASIEEYNQVARKDWILHWPAQVILGVSCLYWTMDVTLAFESNNSTSLMDCNQKLDYQLREMVELVRGPLTSLARKTLGALTTIDVHNRDVVSKMVELGTSKVTDFEWISQLRYYWEDSWKDGQAIKKNMKTLVARIVNAKCLYGYEYLGNTTRLVITALTDRCYRTMIGAVDLLYGGAPEGPAGTGKTSAQIIKLGITSDLFPGVKLPEADYETLLTNIHEVSTNGIEIAPDNVYYIDDKAEYNTKVIQLYEMVLVRHGVMVVGQTCSGKTAIIHTLAKAMTLANSKDNSVYNKVVIYTINPKSVTSGTPEYEDYILKSPEYPHRQYENRSISINLPEEGLLYDYIFDHKTMKWINWLEFNNLTVYKIPNDSKYNNIVIPTIDTVRNEWLIEKLLLKGYHVLCTGETGTGAAPMTELFNLADELGYSNKLLAISLGQGQGPIAENAIMDAIDKEDSYKFSPSGIYSAPDYSFNTLDMYKEVVKNLPYNEGPEIFGLHDNANITCALNETNLLLDTVLNIQTKNISTSSGSNDSIVIDLCIDIENKLPSNYDIEKVLLQFPVRYNESMNTVLVQELISSLFGLQKAIKGLVVMSDSLEQMLLSMSIGKVPSNWSKAAYPSLKPLGSWVNDLLDRLAFLQEWIDRGESPCVYWVSGFYFIQAFITGTLQNFARKHSIPIDKAEFDYRILTPTEMTIANTEKPLEGAYIRGLYMEGARWDSDQHIISESYPRELYMEMPYIHLFPKERSLVPLVKGIPEHYTGSVYGTASVYMCPVYKTSLRQGVLSTTGHSTNFVMFIRIPMNKNMSQKHWIKRGVALLTQLDT
eukprot:gene18662-24408_t